MSSKAEWAKFREHIKRLWIFDSGPFFMTLALIFYLVYAKISEKPIYLVLMIISILVSIFFVIWTIKLLFKRTRKR